MDTSWGKLFTFFVRNLPVNGFVRVDLDEPFFWERKLFCPLFAQAYYRAILDLRLSSNDIFALPSVCGRTFDTPREFGFFLERLVIWNFEGLRNATWACIDKAGLLREANYFSLEDPNASFAYGEGCPFPVSGTLLDGDLKFGRYVPLRWNEESVDVIVCYTFRTEAVAVAVSISTQDSQDHCRSVNFLVEENLSKQLLDYGFSKVTCMLLFIGKQHASTKLILPDVDLVDQLSEQLIFDSPLTMALPVLESVKAQTFFHAKTFPMAFEGWSWRKEIGKGEMLQMLKTTKQVRARREKRIRLLFL
eukprot:TRINITY_DN6723_c0_g1_i1.p1 TRINITY_DN6723_c0_g1~~TRINITY_DN6723_c0_g1_i1.p1  ORF type:complete len:305 (+),score=71.61 TRINITY_DN6723_c0_g1_i1:1139-2053(+)